MATTLSSCRGANQQAAAAGDLGRANAGITIPRQPDECGEAVPHMAIRKGMELRSILKREQGQLDVANKRIEGCFAYNETLRVELNR